MIIYALSFKQNIWRHFQWHLKTKIEYKWKRCSKKKCCKQCGQVKFMGTMTKWPVQKHTEHHKTRSKQRRNRHKEITIFCVFRIFLEIINLNIFGNTSTSLTFLICAFVIKWLEMFLHWTEIAEAVFVFQTELLIRVTLNCIFHSLLLMFCG